MEKIWEEYDFGVYRAEDPVSRSRMAVILDEIAHPFSLPVDLNGQFMKVD